MKSVKWSVAAVLALCLVSGGAMAQWHHRHGPSVHFGVVVGPYWDPWYPYPYRYYYPPAVVVEAAPPVYIQQSPPPAAAAAPPIEYWYYCADAKAYYPYVKECPGGWQKVLPQPR